MISVNILNAADSVRADSLTEPAASLSRDVPCRIILHIHPPYATALAGLADPRLKPIEQVTARFHGMVAVDLGFEDVSITEDEGRRLAALLGTIRC